MLQPVTQPLSFVCPHTHAHSLTLYLMAITHTPQLYPSLSQCLTPTPSPPPFLPLHVVGELCEGCGEGVPEVVLKEGQGGVP